MSAAPPSKRARVEDMESLDSEAINTVRCLSADMVQKAASGHPGALLPPH